MKLLACLALVLAGALAAPLAAQDEKSFDTPYYPLKVGNKWVYAAGPQQVVVLVEARKPVQIDMKDATSGKLVKEKIATYVLKMTSGDKVMTEQVGVLVKGTYRFQSGAKEIDVPAGVYRFQSAGKDILPPECFLKLPLVKDETWDVQCESEGVTIKGSFVAGEATVKVPAGSFQTMTVTSKNLQVGTQPLDQEYWFAPQVGIVKQRVQIGTFQTFLELQHFEAAK
jgi:hypothetical protein